MASSGRRSLIFNSVQVFRQYTSNTNVDASGNMGIGTSKPISRLHVYASNQDDTFGAAGIMVHNAGTGEAGVAFLSGATDPNLWVIGLNSNQGRLDFAYGSRSNMIDDASVDMCITTTGSVGIGTVAPIATLDVMGTIRSGSLAANTVLVSDGKKIIASSTVNSTELNHLSGVTSNVQAQLDARLPLTGGTLSGSLTVQQNAAVQGTLNASNLNVLGTATTINSVVTQNSNVSIINQSGQGPALYVSQSGVGLQSSIAEFYDPEVSTTVPVFKVAEGGNIGISTATPAYALDVVGDIRFTGNLYQGQTSFAPSGTGSGSQWTSNTSTGSISYSGGNVGIGTTNPQAPLHVASTSAMILPSGHNRSSSCKPHTGNAAVQHHHPAAAVLLGPWMDLSRTRVFHGWHRNRNWGVQDPYIHFKRVFHNEFCRQCRILGGGGWRWRRI